MKLSNLKIGLRLGMAFFLVIFFTIISCCIAARSLNNVSNKWQEFAEVTLAKRELVTNSHIKLGDAIHHFKDYVLRGGDYDKKFMSDLDDIAKAESGYRKTDKITQQEIALLDTIAQGRSSYVAAINKAIQMKSAGSSIEEIDKSIAGADQQIATALSQLMDMSLKENRIAGNAISETVANGEISTVLITLAVVILSALGAILVTRSITIPINRAVSIAQTVASGNLTSVIAVDTRDETGYLLLALDDMNQNLQRIVTQVRTSTDCIATSSSQIATGNLDLSSRTEEQASALEQTASSMEELTSTVKYNADNAQQANLLAQSASDIAVRGGTMVTQVIDTMRNIHDSSNKIVDIISVIDGIAFQTNILALNAAVEAARAGEQGRGFAVVASEVRNLAQRSAAAAKEIKILINDSVDSVGIGARLVNEAGITMQDVVTSVNKVTAIINDITIASKEQTDGIEQINQAISQMDAVTQQNAALVEEAAAAAHSMEQQSHELTQVVRQFTLEQS